MSSVYLSHRRIPLFGVIGRLTHQKGFDVLAHCMQELLDWNLQVALLGTGDADAEHYFGELSWQRGDKFRAVIGFNDPLARRIEAGSDFFIMPSRFEPCGLNQMYSLRYGTSPIVRRTGGLADTVENYDEQRNAGTGFCFDDLTVEGLKNTIGWALSTYHDRPRAHPWPPRARHAAGLQLGAGGRGLRTHLPGGVRAPSRSPVQLALSSRVPHAHNRLRMSHLLCAGRNPKPARRVSPTRHAENQPSISVSSSGLSAIGDPVRSPELRSGMRGGERHDAHAAGEARLNARGRILEHHALRGRQTQASRTEQVTLGMGFAQARVFSRDDRA